MNAKSRIDTWQKYQTPIPYNRSRLVHRPIQIQGKSRIDTWQRTTIRRRAQSVNEVSVVFIQLINITAADVDSQANSYHRTESG